MKTIVVDHEPRYYHSVAQALQSHCPQMEFTGLATTYEGALNLMDKVHPALIFMEVDMPGVNAFEILRKTSWSNFETIFFSHSSDQALEAIKHQACGYVLKPLRIEEVIPAFEVARGRIKNKKKGDVHPVSPQSILFPENLIGIPTMEGFDFIRIDDIIRCEGFQRCTRIITKDRSDIISSYHIGVFSKRLSSGCFYLTHKSHLINLQHIRSYLKEGTIKMSDGTCVPVSKRRKSEFLNLLMKSR